MVIIRSNEKVLTMFEQVVISLYIFNDKIYIAWPMNADLLFPS